MRTVIDTLVISLLLNIFITCFLCVSVADIFLSILRYFIRTFVLYLDSYAFCCSILVQTISKLLFQKKRSFFFFRTLIFPPKALFNSFSFIPSCSYLLSSFTCTSSSSNNNNTVCNANIEMDKNVSKRKWVLNKIKNKEKKSQIKMTYFFPSFIFFFFFSSFSF